MGKKNKNIQNKILKVDGSSLQKREKGEITSISIENPTPEQIIQQLQTGKCTVFFYKITNGGFRRMVCTLSEEQPTKSKYNRQGIIVVWDLEAQQWRSFYPDRVFKLIRDEETDAQ
jgi:hypothetical protein